jgi:hypothetical protein
MFYRIISFIKTFLYKTSEQRVKYYSTKILREFNALIVKQSDSKMDRISIWIWFDDRRIRVEVDGKESYGLSVKYEDIIYPDLRIDREKPSDLKKPEVIIEPID